MTKPNTVLSYNEQPLVVCLGRGQDSYGALVGMAERCIQPTAIIFAGVGCEKKTTYEQAKDFDAWIHQVFETRVIEVKYQPKNFKHWPPYHTLLENCLTNVTLPSLAYGYHTCSAKWKIAAINAYLKTQPWAQEWWAKGGKILKAIGFDDTPHERRRAERGCQTFAVQADEADKYELWFPLQQWGWTREDCLAAIKRVGLPTPPKSSCFFCPAMKPAEVDELDADDLRKIIVLEARTHQRHLDHAEAKGWPKGDGIPLIDGLWRKPVQGQRGATPKPGSMTQYIREKGLLPAEEIDRIQKATPTQLFTQADFQRLGIKDWNDWMDQIITIKQQS